MNQTNWTTVASPSNPSASRKTDSIDNPDDATWILTSAFIIFTMQSGFGLLESGSVSRKNEANIFVKNAIDVIFGGLSYWIFGFAFTFALNHRGNGFCGLGYFLTDADENQMGNVFSRYFFQLSFATTATTIVSGAMAERTSLKAYTMYSFLNTLTYSFPAHWIWDHSGWLNRMGAVDIAGCGPVHLVGGVSGLVATLMLKPRTGRFDENAPPRQMASPTNVMLGTFMLWWGWLGFNCGSTFGISGMKWKLASRAAVVTINGSVGGGTLGMMYSVFWFKNKLDIPTFVTGILSGLVGVTAISPLAHPWEAILIGAIGALLACPGCALLNRLLIDDPVGCIPTHCFAGAWGLLAVALFAEKDIVSELAFSDEYGILKGGPWRFLGIQMLTIVAVAAWTAAMTFLELLLVNKIFGLRVSIENELLGADRVEHGILEFEVTLRHNNDAKENDPEQQRSVKINVPDDLPINSGPDDTDKHDKEYNYFWKRARTKTFATKWRRNTVSITETGNGSQRGYSSAV
ncbi:putative ammonium transporter 3 [Montipora foliosa]|uniref:putative ammonium transporter 3 n=1 Tax=Montipora foliosa TaxID=591990 RepID=UPI0035F20CDD